MTGSSENDSEIDDYNLNKKRRMLIIFDMIADILSKKNFEQ